MPGGVAGAQPIMVLPMLIWYSWWAVEVSNLRPQQCECWEYAFVNVHKRIYIKYLVRAMFAGVYYNSP